MKLKRRVIVMRGSKIVRIAVICLLFAVFIKVLGAIGVDEAAKSAMTGFAKNPSLAKLAVGSEVNPALAQVDEDNASAWLNVLRSQSPLLHDVAITPDEPSVEQPDFIPWKLVPPSKPVPKPAPGKALPIKAISINPISPDGYVNLGKIFLKNDSTKKIDLDWLLKSKMPFNLKGRGPHVLIVHTHGSEAYFPEGRNTYTPDDVDRTIDTRYNVVRIGDEVAKILKGQGIDVVHNRNIYDSPTYNGSYTRTLAAISAQMKKTPQIKVIIDIHRDSMVTKSGTQYKTLAKVNGKDAAQIMLVMSTGESGLPNPNWQENLKFGVKLQCQIANKYPGLMRPINLRKERFNMHVTTGSMLIEVGSSANTLQEAINAVTPFSEELARLLKSVRK